MKPELTFFQFFVIAFAGLSIISTVVVFGGVGYFVIRDAFRFGQQDIPVSWMAGIVLLFTGAAYVVAGFPALTIAPMLAIAYAIGRLRRRGDGASGIAKAAEDCRTPGR